MYLTSQYYMYIIIIEQNGRLILNIISYLSRQRLAIDGEKLPEKAENMKNSGEL